MSQSGSASCTNQQGIQVHWHMGQVENHARCLCMMRNRTMEGLDTGEADRQLLLDELTRAKNKLAHHNGDLPRYFFFYLLHVCVATFLRTLQICQSSKREGQSGNRLSTDIHDEWQR